jgi:hypothetical protein
MGPVLEDEYLARAKLYDKQMMEKNGVDLTGKSVEVKFATTREYRMRQYGPPVDAVFKRRGRASDGCPTPERLARIGISRRRVRPLLAALASPRRDCLAGSGGSSAGILRANRLSSVFGASTRTIDQASLAPPPILLYARNPWPN